MHRFPLIQFLILLLLLSFLEVLKELWPHGVYPFEMHLLLAMFRILTSKTGGMVCGLRMLFCFPAAIR